VPCPHRQTFGVCASTCVSQYHREDLPRHQDSPEYLKVEIQHLSRLVHQQQSTITRFEVITGQLQATVTTQVSLGSHSFPSHPASGRLDQSIRGDHWSASSHRHDSGLHRIPIPFPHTLPHTASISRFEEITARYETTILHQQSSIAELQATVTTQVFLGSQFLALTPALGRLDLQT
jgi:hypothetical protein